MTQKEIYSALLNHANSRLENKAVASLYDLFFKQACGIMKPYGVDSEMCNSIFNEACAEIVIRIRSQKWDYIDDGIKRFLFRYCKLKSISLSRESKRLKYSLPYSLTINESPAEFDLDKLLSKIFAVVGKRGAALLQKKFIEGTDYLTLSEQEGISYFSLKNNFYRQFQKVRAASINLDDYTIE
jgi:hypothetical protein